SGDRKAVRPLLAPRRVPERARHEDVEAVREFSHGARSARSGRGRGRGPAPLLADPLSQGTRLQRRSTRGGGGGSEAPGGIPGASPGGKGKGERGREPRRPGDEVRDGLSRRTRRRSQRTAGLRRAVSACARW